MRFVGAVLACVGGCSFTPGQYALGDAAQQAIDAAPDDAGLDGPAIGSDALWVDIEAMQVPCLSETVTSQTTLAAGVTYRLRASGTRVIGTNLLGDAEYWNFNNDTTNDIAANGVIDIGLSIDDPVMDLPKQPHWGAYDPSHVYVVDWVGAGAPIAALYHEQGPANNTGHIDLVIQAFQ